MRNLTASELLGVWERCLDEPSALRASTLLALSDGNAAPHEAAAWSISRRDEGLLALRQQLFGPRVTGITICSQCGELAEIDFSLDDVRVKTSPKRPRRTLSQGNQRLRYRAPTSEDLVAISSVSDPEVARRMLIERCVERADQLPAHIVDKVVARLSGEEAQADIRLRIVCPACNHILEPLFDIASYLWRELDDWARKTLREIHLIASRYGWSETEILRMSARRRRTYLELSAS